MPISFAPDGRLLFSEEVPNHRRDIHVLSLDESRRVESLVHSPGQDGDAEVSQDARWLAYDSDESGQFEVYVRPYPDQPESVRVFQPTTRRACYGANSTI
jgi:Tol biopolymer transport system component